MYNKLRILALNLDDRLYMVYARFKFNSIGEVEWHGICGMINQIIYEINGQSICEINGETFLKINVGNKIKVSI